MRPVYSNNRERGYTHKLTPEERLDLLMECRSNGLTDRQWCHKKGIAPSTFYRWIAQFKKNGFSNVPESKHQHDDCKNEKQEIVRLQVIPEADKKHFL